ncbi:g8490 [Coccomyxa elongata]
MRTRTRTAHALLEKGGGSGVLDRPDLDLSKLPTPATESDLGGGERQKSKKLGGGSYRVMLLDHERHTEKLVVQAITTTIPGTSPEHALNCYHTAKKLGQAIITSCIKEHAEFYSEQLLRQGVSNMIEPDTTTL